LQIDTTAEGIETEEQFSGVAACGCHEVQGFLFSQPVPAVEVSQMLSRINLSSSIRVAAE
jgi:EAL domain-containing protein (putative c-di-GMP-specific phosphodiesterase class I)